MAQKHKERLQTPKAGSIGGVSLSLKVTSINETKSTSKQESHSELDQSNGDLGESMRKCVEIGAFNPISTERVQNVQ